MSELPSLPPDGLPRALIDEDFLRSIAGDSGQEMFAATEFPDVSIGFSGKSFGRRGKTFSTSGLKSFE
jgi:hypothetical protein